MKQKLWKLHRQMWQTHFESSITPHRVPRPLLLLQMLNRFRTLALIRPRLLDSLRVEEIHGEHGILKLRILAQALVPLLIRHPWNREPEPLLPESRVAETLLTTA